MWFSTSSGRIELKLSADDISTGYHSGACDADIDWLRKQPHIAKQLDDIDPALLKSELKEWGAWDDDELSEHEANLARILWLACGDLFDNPTENEQTVS